MHRQMASAAEATFDTKPYKLHKMDTPIAAQGSLTRDDALLYYRQMAVIRRMETAAGNLYKEKVIRGFYHHCLQSSWMDVRDGCSSYRRLGRAYGPTIGL